MGQRRPAGKRDGEHQRLDHQSDLPERRHSDLTFAISQVMITIHVEFLISDFRNYINYLTSFPTVPMSIEGSKIFKVGFIADIKTVTLALKFNCVVSVIWKRGKLKLYLRLEGSLSERKKINRKWSCEI